MKDRYGYNDICANCGQRFGNHYWDGHNCPKSPGTRHEFLETKFALAEPIPVDNTPIDWERIIRNEIHKELRIVNEGRDFRDDYVIDGIDDFINAIRTLFTTKQEGKEAVEFKKWCDNKMIMYAKERDLFFKIGELSETYAPEQLFKLFKEQTDKTK